MSLRIIRQGTEIMKAIVYTSNTGHTAEYAKIVSNLRAAFPNAAMTTDVMVGFAGENEDDFQASMDFVKQIGFSKVHVFPYSLRRGTRAEKMPDHVSPAEKERRAHLMGELKGIAQIVGRDL